MVTASICETLTASTATEPLASTRLSSTSARTCDWMLFVAMTTPTAVESPPMVPKALPPAEVIAASAVARITAWVVASAVTSSAVRSTRSITARTSLRTSLSTTRTPTASESLGEMLMPCGTSDVPSTGFQNPRSV